MFKLDVPILWAGQVLYTTEDAAYHLRQSLIVEYDAEGAKVVRALRSALDMDEAKIAEQMLHDWLGSRSNEAQHAA